jgi:hypothetical protein
LELTGRVLDEARGNCRTEEGVLRGFEDELKEVEKMLSISFGRFRMCTFN